MKKRNRELYRSSHRIPVLIVCQDFNQEELGLVQEALKAITRNDITDTEYSEKDLEIAIESLKQASSCVALSHPSEKAIEALQAVSSGPLKSMRTFPFKVTMGDYSYILDKVIELYFGEKLEMMYQFPDLVKLVSNNSINNNSEFEKFVDELISQQNSIVLSYIYDTADLGSKIALTSKNHDINKRLTDYICPVSKSIFKEKKSKDGDVSLVIDRKELKKLFNMIVSGLAHCKSLDDQAARINSFRW